MKWQAASIVLTMMSLGFCSPKGGVVISGKAQMIEKGPKLEITASDKAIIHWKDFSLEKGEKVKFIQPNKNSAALNKVLGNCVSKIMGTIEANGKVYLINPNGLLIGKEGVIDTAGFVASTLDIHTQAFIDNGALDFIGDSSGNIINLGKISAWDGDILLIGKQVSNEGSLSAKKGEVYLLGSNDVILKPDGEKRLYIKPKNLDLKKMSEEGNPFSAAFASDAKEDALVLSKQGNQMFLVEHSGFIEAENAYVMGDKVVLKDKAIIDVSQKGDGGQVFIGGGFEGKGLINSQQTLVHQDVKISARSLESGNGGAVAIFSDGKTNFCGNIDVRGGAQKGNGGYVEVSGSKRIIFKGITDRTAEKGLPGKLLIDPEADITLHLKDSYTGRFENRLWVPLDEESYIEFGSDSKAGTIVFELTQGDVIIQTSGVGFKGRAGNIIINDRLSYYNPQGNTLTLRAANDIIVNGRLISTDKGNIVLETGRDLLLNAKGSVSPIEVSSFQGTVFLKEIGRDVKLTGGDRADACAVIGCYKTKDHVDNRIKIGKVKGDVLLKGGTNDRTFAQIGTHLSKHAGGHIYFDEIQGDLILEGGTGSQAYAQIGHSHSMHDGGVLKTDIKIDQIGKNLILKGNGGNAHIGHGGFGSKMYHQSGDIKIRSIGKDLLVHAGQKENAFAQIGHANKKGINGSKEGNITIIALKGVCDLKAGDNKGAYALIGHGGRDAYFNNEFIMGNISISTPAAVNLLASKMGETQTFAVIGHAMENSDNIRMHSQGVVVKSQSDICLQGGGASNAVIGMLTGKMEKIGLENIKLFAENNIDLLAYSGQFDSRSTETVIGISLSGHLETLNELETSLKIESGGDISLIASKTPTKYPHNVYIRGVLESDKKMAISNITATNDINILSSAFGQAGLSLSGQVEIISEQGKVKVYSNPSHDAFVTAHGKNLNISAERGIELIPEDEKNPNIDKIVSGKVNIVSGKVNIVRTDLEDFPAIVYSGDVYQPTVPTEIYTIEETNQQISNKLNRIISSGDVVYINAINNNLLPTYTLNADSLDFSCTFTNCTLEVFYQSNIIMSEFLFRQTPILRYMGCPEQFSIQSKHNQAYLEKYFDKREFYTRRPFNGDVKWCNPLLN